MLVCCVTIQKEPRFSLGVGNLACNPNRVGKVKTNFFSVRFAK